MTRPMVYVAIAKVTHSLANKGVGKTRKNTQQGYTFRGIDDLYNALAPELATANLCILPRCLKREVVERRTKNDSALFYVTVDMEFDFISAEDGSKHTVGPFYGEAMDSGDKATNKAMSAAYKYCVMQAFSIPVEGQSIASETAAYEVAPPDLDPAVLVTFERAATMDELAKAWESVPKRDRLLYASVKDMAKQRLVTPMAAQA